MTRSSGLLLNAIRLAPGAELAPANNIRGGRLNSTTASVTVDASPLPALMTQGTPAHRHESISNLAAKNVSVSDPDSTPGSS